MITAEKKKKNKFLPNFEKQSIYSLRYDEMQQWLIDHGQQKFRAKQIFEWLYQKRVNTIETVLMRHEYGNSVCVTTQVGCRIGCTFCA
ncbi:MAG: 23S rRNA (adenine(2503)-C(2))-methyltransferase RlmN, partial [Staphylococcus epidermidis]|nr:23S rRNA (adenine(2503)-C(2))-methyltransferase RlmN [Staphylococcus epidermidis]